MKREKIAAIARWTVSILLAAAFLLAGAPKILGIPAWIERFAHWGYPKWFLLLIGGLEVLGAVLLLVPRTMAYAATVLGIVMLGAGYTHLANGEGLAVLRPMIFLALLEAVVWLRKVGRGQAQGASKGTIEQCLR